MGQTVTVLPSQILPQRSEPDQSVPASLHISASAASRVQMLPDRFVAALLLIAFSPVLVLRALAAWAQTGRVIQRRPRIDHNAREYLDHQFAGHGPGTMLPRLTHVVSGRLALVGPRPLSSIEYHRLSTEQRHNRNRMPCGLVSSHSVRLRLGVAYESEVEADLQLINNTSFRKRLALLARASLAHLIGGSSATPSASNLKLLGVQIDNLGMTETVDRLLHLARTGRHQIAFVNPACLNIAHGDADYRSVLAGCRLVLADGIGLQIAGRVLGHTWAGNVNGTDLFPPLCRAARDANLRLFLLGARPGVATATAHNMQRRFPGLEIAGTHDGYFEPSEASRVIQTVNRSGADILLVAMGAPRQDLWLAQHGDALEAPLRLGVGGLFDFYSGRIERAPRFFRELGLEWAWRLLQEPTRLWKRYLIGNPLFLSRVFWLRVRNPLRPASGDTS